MWLSDVCPDGEELDRTQSTRVCKNCTYGYYRKAGIEENCTKCPKERTTPQMKSVTINDCSLSIYKFNLNINVTY